MRENKRAFNDKLYHIKERSDANMIKFVIECSFIRAFEDALKQHLMTDFTRFSSCFYTFILMLLLMQ